MALVYEPGDALCFRRKHPYKPFKSLTHDVLRLTNKNNSPVAFKVKTTAPKQYCVRPNAGRIEPGESVEVQVVLQPMKEELPADYKCRDKFLIQSIQITPEIESLPVSELWSMAEKLAKDAINEKKLRVRYLPAPAPAPAAQNGTADAAADASKTGINGSSPVSPATVIQAVQKANRLSPPTRPLPGPSPLAKVVDDNLVSAGEESAEPSSPVNEVPTVTVTAADAESKGPVAAAQRLFPDSNAPSPGDTTSYADVSTPASQPDNTDVSKVELDRANSTIAELKRQLQEYRNRLDAVEQLSEKQRSSSRVATKTSTIDGFSSQSVFVVALVAFLFGYFFF
ncbi:phosphatidylinositol-binding protein scs2 [Dipsacomyces acuminosporus]|nr:phosphatidylinositol-binding protein scs2 [Dipsacomyces acuminosporus]